MNEGREGGRKVGRREGKGKRNEGKRKEKTDPKGTSKQCHITPYLKEIEINPKQCKYNINERNDKT